MNKIEPIINRHAAWVVVNPIQGCLNNCSYCFLQRFSSSSMSPQVYADELAALSSLLSSVYYTRDVPICLFTSTDIFSHADNIAYLKKFLNAYKSRSIPNPIVIVTKCKIPEDIIHILKNMNNEVVVYISYSGLPNSLEPNINTDDIKSNFIRLHEAGISIVHYFRPITPLNSDMKTIDRILGFVSRYCRISVISGLKVCEEYRENLSFWPEVQQDITASQAECVWPRGARDNILYIAKQYNHSILENNSCALSYILGRVDEYGFYKTDKCINALGCPSEQRARCERFYTQRSQPDIESAFASLKIDVHKQDNPPTFSIKNNTLYVSNVALSNEDICHLRYLCRMPVCATTTASGFYWNTSMNGAEGKML